MTWDDARAEILALWGLVRDLRARVNLLEEIVLEQEDDEEAPRE